MESFYTDGRTSRNRTSYPHGHLESGILGDRKSYLQGHSGSGTLCDRASLFGDDLSSGMLLITTKPVNTTQNSSPISSISDNVYNGVSHTSAFQSYSRSRSSGSYGQSSDSGISNGNSLSPSTHYNGSSAHLDRPRSPARYLDSSCLADTLNNGLDTSLDLSLVEPRSRSLQPKTMEPISTSGRFTPVSRGLNSSFDWSAGGGKSLSLSRSRLGASMQDLSGVLGVGGRAGHRAAGERRGEDLQQALDDSEDRRQLLVERLRDAQDTIKLQAKRLTEVEDVAKDSTVTVEDLRFKEQDLRKKMTNLEREKGGYHDRYMDVLRAKEGLQQRIDDLTSEVTALRTTAELVQADMSRKDNLVKQLTGSVGQLEEENHKLVKCKETMTKEVSALRQSLELSKSRSDFLENHGKDTIGEVTRLKEENFQLAQDKVKLSQKLSSHDSRLVSLTEENKGFTQSLDILAQDKQQLNKRILSLETTVADLKATLVSTSSDKERFFQEKMDLTSQLQNVSFDKEALTKARNTLEEQLCEMSAELAQVRLQIDCSGEAKRQQEDEMSAVKKVSEVLSMELSGVKARLDQAMDQNSSLEHTKKLALQQHELYEQEIQSLDTQLKQSKQMVMNLRDDQHKDKESSDKHAISLKEEIKELKMERNQLELRCHETDAKLRQSEHNLKEHSENLTAEVDSWKDQCEKATASSSRRELEIQTLQKRVLDLEDELVFVRDNQALCEEQCEELKDAKEDANRAREENRRLLQERAENQQVIQLLEMQKEILAKTTEGSMSKVHDTQQLQYQVEQLTIERTHLEEKLSLMEQRVQERMQNEISDDAEDRLELPLATRERLCELESQNQQLRALNSRITEQLTRVEQENVTVQAKFRDCVPKADLKSAVREREVVEESLAHVRSQYARLEEQYKNAMSADRNRAVQSQDLFLAQKEKSALDHQVKLLSQQIEGLEDNKRQADDKRQQLEKQLDAVHEKLFAVCQEDNSQVLQLQKQVNNLTTELESAKSLHTQQDAMLQSLKQALVEEKNKNPTRLTQSLDSVGEDLTAVRRELQQLGDVIQSKDLEIEQLDRKLREARQQLRDRDKQVEILTAGTGSGKDEGDGPVSSTSELTKKKMQEKMDELEEENDEIQERIAKIRKERDMAVRDAEDLRDGLDDLQKICDTEHVKRIENMKKELSAKDRQIESLEEQLRRNTNIEIKKLKRGASKMELLKAENRRLQSQIIPATSHLPRFTPPDEPTSPEINDEPKSIGARLGERLQGAGLTPSQRLLDRLHSTEDRYEDVKVQPSTDEEKCVESSWDEDSSDAEELDPSTKLMDDLNNRSMSKLHGRPQAEEDASNKDNMNFVRRSWQKLDEDELTASSKALRHSVDGLDKLSDRVSSLKLNGLKDLPP